MGQWSHSQVVLFSVRKMGQSLVEPPPLGPVPWDFSTAGALGCCGVGGSGMVTPQL